MTWHVLDVRSVWVKEFTGALTTLAPVVGWSPEMSWSGIFGGSAHSATHSNPAFQIRYFPLQKGYSRGFIAWLVRLGSVQTKRLESASGPPDTSPLICTTPFYAPVAENWRGPVIYYQTDLTYAYAGVNSAKVLQLDRRLCKAATVVCPNSNRIGQYFVDWASCDPSKIVIVPNATRGTNVLAEPALKPAGLPTDLADLPLPVVGVLGNLAANLDWCLLLEAVTKSPTCSWAFIGPTDMPVPDPMQRMAREELKAMAGRVRFVGAKSYDALQAYARAIDVAVLPYIRKEPTYSGSSTRFYEHLAACRPMISTRGFEELTHKEPLVKLVDTADELVRSLADLARTGFSDGFEEARWQASKRGTWEVRAATIIKGLQDRFGGDLQLSSATARFAEEHSQADPFAAEFGAPFELASSVH